MNRAANVKAANRAVVEGFAVRGVDPVRPRRASHVYGDTRKDGTTVLRTWFANGYAASVVSDPKEHYTEVAVINGQTGNIDYTTPLTRDVERFSSPLELAKFRFKVANLPTIQVD